MRREQIFVSHQGCIPSYRKSFYTKLNALGARDYVVIHGSPPSGMHLRLATPPYEFPNIKVKNYELALLGRTFIWQPILYKVLRGEFDAAVIGDEVKYISNLVVALVQRLRGRPVILWGFGYHQYGDRQASFIARITAALADVIKARIYSMVSGYLTYTRGGEKALRRAKHRPPQIAVLMNTVDTEREGKLRLAVADEPIAEIFQRLQVTPERVKLLYFGQLIPRKGVDILIGYARHAAGKYHAPPDIIISGRGPEERRLRGLAAGLPNVVFHALDDFDLARALRISNAVVIPGIMGLAVTHSYAHGVPMLTRRGQLHSPEIEYIEDRVNGLILPDPPEEFFAALDSFIEDPILQRRLAAGAELTAKAMDMNRMAAAFDRLVTECLAASPREKVS
jgi:glycosyltransferase involved in cell wall biosynthesis